MPRSSNPDDLFGIPQRGPETIGGQLEVYDRGAQDDDDDELDGLTRSRRRRSSDDKEGGITFQVQCGSKPCACLGLVVLVVGALIAVTGLSLGLIRTDNAAPSGAAPLPGSGATSGSAPAGADGHADDPPEEEEGGGSVLPRPPPSADQEDALQLPPQPSPQANQEPQLPPQLPPDARGGSWFAFPSGLGCSGKRDQGRMDRNGSPIAAKVTTDAQCKSICEKDAQCKAFSVYSDKHSADPEANQTKKTAECVLYTQEAAVFENPPQTRVEARTRCWVHLDSPYGNALLTSSTSPTGAASLVYLPWGADGCAEGKGLTEDGCKEATKALLRTWSGLIKVGTGGQGPGGCSVRGSFNVYYNKRPGKGTPDNRPICKVDPAHRPPLPAIPVPRAYFTLTDRSVKVDTYRIDKELDGQGILFIGASITDHLVRITGLVTGNPKLDHPTNVQEHTDPSTGFKVLRCQGADHGSTCDPYSCMVAKLQSVSIASCTFPGSGEPPYFPGIVTESKPVFLQEYQLRGEKWLVNGTKAAIRDHPAMLNNKQPSLVILDMSFRHLETLWMLRNQPKSVEWEVPDEDIIFWCHVRVPETLAKVSKTFPDSTIAFLVAPQVRESYHGHTSAALDKMANCVRQKLQGTEHVLLDFAAIVQDELMKSTSPGSSFADAVRPSRRTSLRFMNLVLQTAKEAAERKRLRR